MPAIISTSVISGPDGGDPIDITLIDIPSSLTAPPNLLLRSSSAPTTPYSLPEPRDHTKLLNPSLEGHHSSLRPLLTSALNSIPKSLLYRPRFTIPADASAELDFHTNTSLLTSSLPPLTFTHPKTALSDLSDLYLRTCTNSHRTAWTTLTLQYPSPPKRFHIPPRSSFLLSSVADPSALSEFRSVFAATKLDFLLLDPPWPNRSVQRKNKHSSSSYPTPSRFEILPLLKKIPVAETVKVGSGLVAVWMTNRMSLRERFLREVVTADEKKGGWGCEVEAEWVWGKVTTKGEWVYDLESKVRKPYESLVLLRRNGCGEKAGQVGKRKVGRRVMVAVPDLHSRKMGVKELVEPFLPSPYRACEIFGRSLTEGWFTWGDEAIKWNWEGHWVPADSVSDGNGPPAKDTEMAERS